MGTLSPKKLIKKSYAPFCKHIFVENFTPAFNYYQEITTENEHLLKSEYESRTEKELPVLCRWFPADKFTPHIAKYLDVILYSKDQIQKENEAMGNTDPNMEIDYDWGVISVKAQDIAEEIQMNPITMMRNALGKEEGGSGVPLEREKYMKSVEFWQKNALFK